MKLFGMDEMRGFAIMGPLWIKVIVDLMAVDDASSSSRLKNRRLGLAVAMVIFQAPVLMILALALPDVAIIGFIAWAALDIALITRAHCRLRRRTPNKG